jgi:hypothetical protein
MANVLLLMGDMNVLTLPCNLSQICNYQAFFLLTDVKSSRDEPRPRCGMNRDQDAARNKHF